MTAPDSLLERASIDEAFIDFTRAVLDVMLERWPHLSKPPQDDMDSALPTPPPINWDGLGHLIPSNDGVEDPEAFDHETTWHDVALSIAAELMDNIRKEIDSRFGYTTSAVCSLFCRRVVSSAYAWIQGLAKNKFLAKV